MNYINQIKEPIVSFKNDFLKFLTNDQMRENERIKLRNSVALRALSGIAAVFSGYSFVSIAPLVIGTVIQVGFLAIAGTAGAIFSKDLYIKGEALKAKVAAPAPQGQGAVQDDSARVEVKETIILDHVVASVKSAIHVIRERASSLFQKNQVQEM